MVIEICDGADGLARVRDLDQHRDLDHQGRAGEDGDGVRPENQERIGPFLDAEPVDENVANPEDDEGRPGREDHEGACPELLVDRKERMEEGPLQPSDSLR